MLELRVAWGTLRNVLRIYVGDEPRQAILSGNVKRGQVSTIRSAILFADMRDSTEHTVELGAVGMHPLAMLARFGRGRQRARPVLTAPQGAAAHCP